MEEEDTMGKQKYSGDTLRTSHRKYSRGEMAELCSTLISTATNVPRDSREREDNYGRVDDTVGP